MDSRSFKKEIMKEKKETVHKACGESGPTAPLKKTKKRKDECFYHLCNGRIGLTKCPYCGEKYCEEHKEPYQPYYGEILVSSYGAKGHPCVGYHKLLEEQSQELGNKIENAYKKAAIKKAGKQRLPESIKIRERAESFIGYLEYSEFWGKARLGLLILAALFFLFWVSSIFLHHQEGGCYGDMKSGECFDMKPFYCFNGTVIENAIKCGCPSGTTFKGQYCLKNCGELASGYCSEEKPYFCINGTLVRNSTECGCPTGFVNEGEDCVEPTCQDGTVYGKCSLDKPYFCLSGALIRNASRCGCPENEVLRERECVSIFTLNPKNSSFPYTLRYSKGELDLTLYGGLNEYLGEESREYYYCTPECPTDEEIQLGFLEDEHQEQYLKKVAEAIKLKTDKTDDQLRIAVSFVQNIPYDDYAASVGYYSTPDRYPYQVLYDNKGICAEKSRLLAVLLKELGYSTALLYYELEEHMAVGVECPNEYSTYTYGVDQGYCFIESTRPSIITDNKGNYLGVGALSSRPELIIVSEGKEFESVSDEFEDAKRWNALGGNAWIWFGYLTTEQYDEYSLLVNKYGFVFTD